MVQSLAAFAGLVTLSGLLPMAFSLQQEKAGELHAGSMLSHPLIQSLTLSEDGIDCELSCNGETMDVDVKDVLKHGVSCWGKYSQKCKGAMDGSSLSSIYKCEGAFTYVPLNSTKNAQGFPSVGTSSCEGAMLIMSEKGKSKDLGEVVSGMFCVAKAQVVYANVEGYEEEYFQCGKDAAWGSAVKHASDGSTHGRKDHMHDDSEPSMAEFLEQSLTCHLWEDWVAHTDSSSDIVGLADVAGTDAIQEDLQDAAGVSQLPAKEAMLAADMQKSFKWTCNKKKIHPWLSWWPCWGKTEFEYKEDSEDHSLNVDIACHGFAVPIWMSCKGLSTIHGHRESEIAFNEVMEVTQGKKRLRKFRKHDWVGQITRSSGFNTLHTRQVALDSEPSDAVRDAVDTFTQAAIGQRLQGV